MRRSSGEFDAVWASPPCQAYTRNARQKGTADSHPDLIEPTRTLLDTLDLPYCMENVEEAPLRPDLTLCGSMFGLKLVRHRIFEVSSFVVAQPEHGEHHPDYITVTGHAGGSSNRDGGKHFGNTEQWKEAMGIDWLPGSKIKEAVPPDVQRTHRGGDGRLCRSQAGGVNRPPLATHTEHVVMDLARIAFGIDLDQRQVRSIVKRIKP